MASLLSIAAVITTMAGSAVLPVATPTLVARSNADCSEAAAQVVAKTGGQLLSVQPLGDSCVITVLVQGNGERPRKVTVKAPME
jgi:parvulin-like peptidyl-prolyl isomerase